jgi:hypothetical protein
MCKCAKDGDSLLSSLYSVWGGGGVRYKENKKEENEELKQDF